MKDFCCLRRMGPSAVLAAPLPLHPGHPAGHPLHRLRQGAAHISNSSIFPAIKRARQANVVVNCQPSLLRFPCYSYCCTILSVKASCDWRLLHCKHYVGTVKGDEGRREGWLNLTFAFFHILYLVSSDLRLSPSFSFDLMYIQKEHFFYPRHGLFVNFTLHG